MSAHDPCVTLVPYFQAKPGQLGALLALVPRFIDLTRQEPKCLHYAFSVEGDRLHCREGYADAAGVLAHLDNVGALLSEALRHADIERLEVHGPERELERLRIPLAALSPAFFVLLPGGFRR